MTKRQRDVLDAIAVLSAGKGHSPSFYEIGEKVGIKSSGTVHKHLQNLLGLGLIEYRAFSNRSIKITHIGKKAIGKHACPKCGFEMRGAA